MSHYRDELDAARHRITTLEAEIAERDASLRARDAQIAEHRRELDRVRAGRGEPPGKTAHKPPAGSRSLPILLLSLMLGALVLALAASLVRIVQYRHDTERLYEELDEKDDTIRALGETVGKFRMSHREESCKSCADSDNCCAGSPSYVQGSIQQGVPLQGTGFLNIHSSPFARVLLDGKPIGTTPLASIAVAPGSHVLQFIHSDSQRQSVHVTVEDGQTQTIHTNLPDGAP